MNIYIFALILISSLKCFSQEVVFYSDTIVFEERVKSEDYYAVKGKLVDLVDSPRFQDISWFVNQLKEVMIEKRLNDYFIYELTKNYSNVFFTKKNSTKYQTAFVYAVLNQLEFDLIISDRDFIYIYSKDEILNTRFHKKGSKTYYCIYPVLGGGAFYYNMGIKKKSNKKKDFNLRVKETPKLKNAIYINKQITYAISKNVYKDSILLNATLLNMYEKYPQVSFCAYEQAEFSDSLKISFNKNILPKLIGENEKESVRNILSFCQSVIEYATDESVYHKNRSLFPEELLYFNKGDCEDYSFLFVYLIREYTKLNTVFIDYYDNKHVNSAVGFPYKIVDPIQQYSLDGYEYFDKPTLLKYKGENYYISDPTGSSKYRIGEPIDYDLTIGEKPRYNKYKIIDCSCNDK